MTSVFLRGALAAALSGLLLLTGCARTGEPSQRLIVLGVDGLEWSLVLRLVREGRMPETARLMSEGFYGSLDTLEPTSSAVIWTSIATGKSPPKHGILGWTIHEASHPRKGQLYSNGERKTKAFWNIASDRMLRVAVVGWFVTYPVEPVNGLMVAQTNTSLPKQWLAGQGIAKGGLVEGLPRQVYPPERQEEVMEILARTNGGLADLKRTVFGDLPSAASEQVTSLLEASDWSFRSDATYAAVAEKIAAERPAYDVLAVYLGGTDVVGHRFWRYMDPASFKHPPTEEEVRSFGRMIPDYYAYADGVLGRLRKLAGDGATILMLSDHGMHATNADSAYAPEDRGAKLLSGHHRDAPPGFFAAAGPGIRRLPAPPNGIAGLDRSAIRRAGHVFDVAPTVLTLLGIAVGGDMDGKVMKKALDPDFLRRRPVRSVPTHDTPEWIASRPKSDEAEPNSAERMEQLRSLGYVK